MPPSGKIEMRLLRDMASLDKVAPLWNELVASGPSSSLMLSTAWIYRWFEYYGDNRELRVGQFFDGDTCIGFAPICARTHNYRGGISFERLEFMGAEGQDDDAISSDYLNLIAAPGREDDVADHFAKHLLDGKFGVWHECVLDAMNGDNPMVEHLSRAFADRDRPVEREQITEAPYLPLTPDWDSYVATLSKSRRYWFRRTFRDFESYAGAPGYSLHHAVDDTSLDKGMAILQELHGARWESAGETGVFDSERFRQFHASYAHALLKQNRLQLVWLNIADKPVAAQYNLLGDDKVYFYQSGRLMGTPPKVRLGIALFMLTITDAMEKGYQEFDFLAGEDDYKYLFTKQTRPIVSLRITRPSARETLRRTLVQGRELTKLAKNSLSGQGRDPRNKNRNENGNGKTADKPPAG